MKNKLLKPTDISESLTSILNSMGDAVIIADENQNCLFFNPTAERIFGNDSITSFSENLLQRFDFYQSDQVTPFRVNELPLIRSIQGEEVNDVEMFMRHAGAPNGLWIKVTGRPLKDRNGVLKGSVIVCRDITKNKQVEHKLLHDTFYDELTDLANRTLVLKLLEHSIACNKQREGYIFAVLCLDLDRFKVINDSFGHQIGDQLLIAVSQRLKTCLRAEDTIARLSSDEFAILLENIQDVSCATQIAERIYKELMLPFNLNGHEVFANASIGIVMGNTGYDHPEELLRDADTAMAHAKKIGRACYQVFDKTMHTRVVKRLQLENNLRRAIERQEFQLYYQPIVSLRTKRISGFEALIRWQHPERGLISPSEFIPIAEETGLIIPLGLWVLREACRQMRSWQTKFPDTSCWKISVNVSSKQLSKANFIEQVQQILQETGFEARNLKLEITESILVENTKSVIATLEQLKALGIELSMDDFGTGYSSLSYLQHLPIQTLKIDRSFIQSMETSVEKLAIIRAILTLAWNLSMDVVAEGVETANQLAQLKVLKCGYGQGYFFSKSLNHKAAEALIAAELAELDSVKPEEPKAILEEQHSREQLLLQIENLYQELEELKQEKVDLEILLETATEHADLVESELQMKISNHQKTEAALQKENQELEHLILLDSLTQVGNRRSFDDYLIREWRKMVRENLPISLVLCDIDYFKSYNDTYGHLGGDNCLHQIAQAISRTIKRPGDLVARYGGEEFAVILPNTKAKGAVHLAENIRLEVKTLNILHFQSPISKYVTLSLGVFCTIPTEDSSPKFLIDCADQALYEAKARGRDRVILKV